MSSPIKKKKKKKSCNLDFSWCVLVRLQIKQRKRKLPPPTANIQKNQNKKKETQCFFLLFVFFFSKGVVWNVGKGSFVCSQTCPRETIAIHLATTWPPHWYFTTVTSKTRLFFARLGFCSTLRNGMHGDGSRRASPGRLLRSKIR